jgi:hypothetical protein
MPAESPFCGLGGDAGPTQRIHRQTTPVPRGFGEIQP